MYQDLHVIDFHSHFPSSKPWFGGGPNMHEAYVQRVGKERAQVARKYGV